MPTRFNRPAASSRDFHEPADTPKQALSSLAHPWRYVATNYSTNAHFQNHVRGFQRMLRSGERTQRSVSSPPLPSRWAQCSGQFVWPTSAWTVSWYIVAGLAQRLLEPWTGRSRFLSHSWVVIAVVVIFLFVSPRHAVGLGAVSEFVAVFAGILAFSPKALCAFVAAFAGILTVTVAVLFASGYEYLGSPAWSQVTLPFSCCGHMEILTWSFENSPGPHEAEGSHSTWPQQD